MQFRQPKEPSAALEWKRTKKDKDLKIIRRQETRYFKLNETQFIEMEAEYFKFRTKVRMKLIRPRILGVNDNRKILVESEKWHFNYEKFLPNKIANVFVRAASARHLKYLIRKNPHSQESLGGEP